jgi:hypothetical protein
MTYAPNFIAHQKTAFFAVYDAIQGGPGGVLETLFLTGMAAFFPLFNKQILLQIIHSQAA